MMKKFFSKIKKNNNIFTSRTQRKFPYFSNVDDDKRKRLPFFNVFARKQQAQKTDLKTTTTTNFGKKILKDYNSKRLIEGNFNLDSEEEEEEDKGEEYNSSYTAVPKKTAISNSSDSALKLSFPKRKSKRQLRRERRKRIRARFVEVFSSVTNRENSKFSSKKNSLKSLFFSFIKNGNRKQLLNSTVPYVFSSFKQKKKEILRGRGKVGRRFQIKNISSFLKFSFSKIFPIVGLTTKRIAGVNRPIPKIFKKKSSCVTPAVAWVKKALGYRKEFPYRYRIFRELESIADSSSYIYKYKQDHYNRVSNNKNFLFSRKKKKRI